MSDSNKPSLRIDWFDGSLIEDTRLNSVSSSSFADEDVQETPEPPKPRFNERRTMGFKKIFDMSTLNPAVLTLELSNRDSFWNLLNIDLKGDFIVLVVKILVKLYQSIQLSETTMINTILKAKFEKSIFLETLKNYLQGLPSVRIVGKPMNSHLWADVESFFMNVLNLCDGLVTYGTSNAENTQNAYDVIEVLEASIVGVRQEHTERFSNELFERIYNLKTKIKDSMEKMPDKQSKVANKSEHISDINHFKNLSIYPTKADLVNRIQVRIKPNIISGAYPNVEEYLDLQFKLLREDCFGPLRDGICKYLENPSKNRHENIRVHPKVRVIRTYVSNNKVGHLVDIAWSQRSTRGTVDSRKYSYNKQLMFGSLLLFTSDNFNTILCATVLESNINLLCEGYIAVSFQNPVSNKIFSEPYIMVESEVFFEPYHRVLKVIQDAKTDDLPMRKYIVDVLPDTKPPSYLSEETQYSMKDSQNKGDITFSVLNKEWPSNECFGLDESQMEAYKFALTREFAVIQGPPGTGKTYLGVKIATTLLKNLSLEGTPMLIICYTNHALDQFLEGVLDATKNVIRLGSQSKSKQLEPYTLNKARSRMKSKYSYLYASKKTELEKIFNDMTELQLEMEKCEKEVLSYKCVKPYLKLGDKELKLKCSIEDPLINWLFSHLEEETENGLEESDDCKKQIEDLQVTNKIETSFSEDWARKEIDSMLNSIKYVKEVAEEHLETQKMVDKFERHIDKIKNRINIFKKFIILDCKEEIEDIINEYTVDLYNLEPEARWKVYIAAVRNIKNRLITKMNLLLDLHKTCSDELNEVATLIDVEVMKCSRVVGLTTTTAARRHDLLRKILSPIVIVEEAAEVLEAHIVASLTYQCQHLILIGDHKQLRPSAAHYKLAKDFNLEISLMERMIRNGVHARTLSTQRRMRKEFVELLVPIVYDRLDSHPVVYSYPDARGMKDNLFFLNHSVLEDSEGLDDSWSHRNTFEAQWCVHLADYLRRIQYKPEEITILTTYTGQATLIKELSKKFALLRDVKVTVVDNYQGEENRIVILSLVRSNRDGKIGFLSAVNRICVALSRAKEGFYIFGNINMLQSASSIWRQINKTLIAQKAIGPKLVLRCETHKDNFLDIEHAEDFNNCFKGNCLRTCPPIKLK